MGERASRLYRWVPSKVTHIDRDGFARIECLDIGRRDTDCPGIPRDCGGVGDAMQCHRQGLTIFDSGSCTCDRHRRVIFECIDDVVGCNWVDDNRGCDRIMSEKASRLYRWVPSQVTHIDRDGFARVQCLSIRSGTLSDQTFPRDRGGVGDAV